MRASISCEPSGRIGQTEGEFSVCQFFQDGTYEYVRRYCGPMESVQAFRAYCTSVGARQGFTVRVIVTDGGDCCVMEWKRDEGVVHPADLPGVTGRHRGGAP